MIDTVLIINDKQMSSDDEETGHLTASLPGQATGLHGTLLESVFDVAVVI